MPHGWDRRTFSALNDPHFRNLWAGNLAQMASMQMQLVVRGWLVYQITGSYAALGVMALANAIPSLLVSPIGGVVADRAIKKTVIQSAQLYNAANAGLLAILAAGMFGLHLEFWHLFLSAFLQGIVNSIMQPSRQAMISDLVPRDRLMNAIGINSSGQTMMQLLGPAVAGFLIAAISPALVFGVMAMLYVVASGFTWRLPRHPLYAYTRGVAAPDAPRRRRGAASFSDLIGGLKYVAKEPTIRMVLGVNFLIVVVAMPYAQLLPGFVSSVLHEGAAEQGVLQSLQGVGAFAGAIFVASAPSHGRGKLFLGFGAALGVAVGLFSLSTVYLYTLPIMLLLGFGQAGRMAIGQVLIQEYAEDAYRGRVVAVWFMEFGLVQIGTFMVGLLAEAFGPQIAIGGIALVLVISMGVIATFVPRMRNLD